VFFGASTGTAVLAPVLGERLIGNGSTYAQTTVPLSFTPVRLPHPLPIYQKQVSYLPTGIGKGNILQPVSDAKLTTYTVLDDVIVPPEYERYVIVRWGDRVFPNKDDYFGFNCDYTAFVPVPRQNSDNGYLWVNHEYVSYPISAFAPDTPEDVTDTSQFPEAFPAVIGFKSSEKNRELLGEFLYNVGGSVVRIARDNNGRYQVVNDPNNRRIHGLSGLALNNQRNDQYKGITSWGNSSHQKGDNNYLIGTGPAAKEVFNLSSDGLGDKIIGTAYNCAGGITPWGTIFSAEENFQGNSTFFVSVTEAVKPDGTQLDYTEGTTGAEFGLVGEKYGWMVEVDPANPKFRPRKHTALGRFRHESVAIRAEVGKKLLGYMGDDRRGGHTWKFVSKGTVVQPVDGNQRKDNSVLFEDGILYVAKFNPPANRNEARGTGEWIPLVLSTRTNPILPSVLAAVELAALGTASRDGLIKLPSRVSTGQEVDGGGFDVTIQNEATALPAYQGKKLSDFYPTQGAVLVDAFIAANLIGGTPTARPEDIEINPRNPREVFIAYTDGAAGSDGYPDSRIFVVSKYSEAVTAGQPSGELIKIIEDSEDGSGTTFRWERFVKGGEAGAEPGDGFANVDNLAFDNQGNIWGVTDMSTSAHNGFNVGAAAEVLDIEHTVVGSNSPSVIDSNKNVETSNLVGVFGNNWLFLVPTTGEDAGELVPFAYGPPRCEMTGPYFVGNDTLIIAVQHPGEDCPYTPQVTLSREIEMLNLDGTLFKQKRTLPRGSNWPSNIEGKPQGAPRPSVIGIRRKDGKSTFV
jgi:secreted PhoX family phosphatase